MRGESVVRQARVGFAIGPYFAELIGEFAAVIPVSKLLIGLEAGADGGGALRRAVPGAARIDLVGRVEVRLVVLLVAMDQVEIGRLEFDRVGAGVEAKDVVGGVA